VTTYYYSIPSVLPWFEPFFKNSFPHVVPHPCSLKFKYTFIIILTKSRKAPLKHFLTPNLTIFILQLFDFLICYLNGEVFTYSTFNRIDCTSITITIFSTYLILFIPRCFCVCSYLSFNFFISPSRTASEVSWYS
jgi:hypothetical protein